MLPGSYCPSTMATDTCLTCPHSQGSASNPCVCISRDVCFCLKTFSFHDWSVSQWRTCCISPLALLAPRRGQSEETWSALSFIQMAGGTTHGSTCRDLGAQCCQVSPFAARQTWVRIPPLPFVCWVTLAKKPQKTKFIWRESVWAEGGQRERKRHAERESQAGSTLSAQSLMRALNP